MTKTKTTPVLLDRLAGALAVHGVTLKRTHLLQAAARAFGYDNTHTFTADDRAGELSPPAADYLGCDEVSGYGMMEFFGDPEGGIFAVQKDRIEALAGRKDDWILSPMGGVLDISGLRRMTSAIAVAAAADKAADSAGDLDMITDEAIRHIIETARCDEDSVCRALVHAREHFHDNSGQQSEHTEDLIEEAEFQWNEEGSASSAMEALRAFWENQSRQAEPGVQVACSNCEWTGREEDCRDIVDIHQRVGAGETMPAGECPECGALAHLVQGAASSEGAIPSQIAARALGIRNDYDAALARGHRPDDAMEQLEPILRQAERAILDGDAKAAEGAIGAYGSIVSTLGKDARNIDPESPIYLTNGCCEFPHEYGWMFEGSGLECGSFDGDFYPLTEEEAAFIAEDVVSSSDGRMHALTGYSALYRGRKHIMPSIELPVGAEHDAPSSEEVRRNAEEYVAAILPKVAALEGNILIDSGIDDCVVIQILVPFSKVRELDNQWYPMLEWLMVDPRMPDVEEHEERRHEGRDYAVTVSWIGEGNDGDYDPMRPLDHPLLRFDVQRNAGIVDSEWEDQEDGSYCTQVPAYASPDVVRALPRYLTQRLDTEGGSHPKRLMEQLSWTGIGHVERFLVAERNKR